MLALQEPRETIAIDSHDAGNQQKERPQRDLQVHEDEKPRHLERPRETAESVRKPAAVVIRVGLQHRPHEPIGHDCGEDIGEEHLEQEAAHHPSVRLERRQRVTKPRPPSLHPARQELAQRINRERGERGRDKPVDSPCNELEDEPDDQQPPEPLALEDAPSRTTHFLATFHDYNTF